VVYNVERFAFHNESGAFVLDVWRKEGKYYVHAVQADIKQSAKGFAFHALQRTAIENAIEYVVEQNNKYL
jgi:hypothetical protein